MPVTFTSKTGGICSVSGSQVTTLALGTCTIAADQGGDGSYFLPATTVLQSFPVPALPQSITFNSITPFMINASAPLSATATSGLAVTFSSQTPAVCSVSGTTVTGITAGTCTVAANQAGDATQWAAAPTVTQNVTVARDAQAINFPSI